MSEQSNWKSAAIALAVFVVPAFFVVWHLYPYASVMDGFEANWAFQWLYFGPCSWMMPWLISGYLSSMLQVELDVKMQAVMLVMMAVGSMAAWTILGEYWLYPTPFGPFMGGTAGIMCGIMPVFMFAAREKFKAEKDFMARFMWAGCALNSVIAFFFFGALFLNIFRTVDTTAQAVLLFTFPLISMGLKEMTSFCASKASPSQATLFSFFLGMYGAGYEIFIFTEVKSWTVVIVSLLSMFLRTGLTILSFSEKSEELKKSIKDKFFGRKARVAPADGPIDAKENDEHDNGKGTGKENRLVEKAANMFVFKQWPRLTLPLYYVLFVLALARGANKYNYVIETANIDVDGTLTYVAVVWAFKVLTEGVTRILLNRYYGLDSVALGFQKIQARPFWYTYQYLFGLMMITKYLMKHSNVEALNLIIIEKPVNP